MSEMPDILKRVLGFKSIVHKEGSLYIWGIPMYFEVMSTRAAQQKIMVDEFGREEASSIIYSMGKLTSYNALKTFNEKFGVAKTIPDKKKLLQYNTGQLDIIGAGKFEWSVMNFDKVHFVMRGNSAFAEVYKKSFGIQKHHVDFFIRGQVDAAVKYLTGKDVLAIETSCIAKGKKYCEFVIKERKKWDLKDPAIKKQLVRNIPETEKLILY
ncbi:MAG: 4-vinyl reductase [Nanoarchaeota archaeon]|nr:4-vinyl reductase [Nanoarchaeota archaeon]